MRAWPAPTMRRQGKGVYAPVMLPRLRTASVQCLISHSTPERRLRSSRLQRSWRRRSSPCGECSSVSIVEPNTPMNPGHTTTDRFYTVQGSRDVVDLSSTTPQTRSDHHVSPTGMSMTPSDGNGKDWDDFNALPFNAVDELCTLWFDRYHLWFPILHKLSFLESVRDWVMRQGGKTAHNVVLKAILAFTLPQWSSATVISREQRLEISTQLQTEVVVYASTNLSLQSLQPALIITNIDYGAGDLHRFGNVIAICKRYDTVCSFIHFLAECLHTC